MSLTFLQRINKAQEQQPHQEQQKEQQQLLLVPLVPLLQLLLLVLLLLQSNSNNNLFLAAKIARSSALFAETSIFDYTWITVFFVADFS